MTGRAVVPALGDPALGDPALGAPAPGSPALARPSAYRQPTFDELGTPLAQTTFCVVDLETTGGSPAGGAGITEIGAVRVCGGEVTGEFQTLVNPGEPVPAFIAVLTGITTEMVAGSPRIAPVLAAFFEFARGCVLVAHNAPFDVGFLKAAAGAAQIPWPGYGVVDTAVLARRVLAHDEVPNCKLSTLAPFFRATTKPEHRALADARATVDVLHGLFERLGPLGVHTLEELATYNARVSSVQRGKRHLAEKLPTEPGVYLFTDAQHRVLYIGTSGNLRRRVRSYFTGSETRSRMGEMVGLAHDVTGIACATRLEAQARELRLIAAHKPRYNRRSKFPEKMVLAQAHRRAVPAAVGGARGQRRRRPPTWVRSAPRRPLRRSQRRSTKPPSCASARRGCPVIPTAPHVRWPRWTAASRPATGGSRSRSTQARSSRSSRRWPVTRATW